MLVGKLCIKLFDFECKNILNPETVSKVSLQLHYDEAKDLAFCHLCMLAYRDGKLRSQNLDKAFIINGFSN